MPGIVIINPSTFVAFKTTCALTGRTIGNIRAEKSFLCYEPK
jgi:hypothetical protein